MIFVLIIFSTLLHIYATSQRSKLSSVIKIKSKRVRLSASDLQQRTKATLNEAFPILSANNDNLLTTFENLWKSLLLRMAHTDKKTGGIYGLEFQSCYEFLRYESRRFDVLESTLDNSIFLGVDIEGKLAQFKRTKEYSIRKSFKALRGPPR